MNLFFNTTGLDGQKLLNSIQKCEGQNAIITEIFQNCMELTPSEAHEIFCKFKKRVPITSIRRSITTLTNKGILIKLPKKKPGIYGELEHFWKIK